MSKLEENDTKIVIYGCGTRGRDLAEYFPNDYDFPKIVAFIDKNVKGNYMGIPVLAPERIGELKFDYVIIACIDLGACQEIKRTLLIDLKVEKEKIIDMDRLVLSSKVKSRTNFLNDFARYCKQKNLSGSVAEAGVHRGDFAKFINIYFNDRTLYLFDTFEGFNEEELKIEKNLGMPGFIKGLFCDNKELFSNTEIALVREKMMNEENVVIRQGIFPDTALDIDDFFCFVSLDMDLYRPTLNGLKYFWDKMVRGGCILVHDYFHENLPGVRKAVYDFEQEMGIELYCVPIGDGCSIAIIKNTTETSHGKV